MDDVCVWKLIFKTEDNKYYTPEGFYKMGHSYKFV